MSSAQALLALAEAESASVAAGRAEELADLEDRWRAALDGLPRELDAHARMLVARALDLQGETAERLRAARDAVAAELAGTGRSRAGARAYAPVDEDHPLVDRAA